VDVAAAEASVSTCRLQPAFNWLLAAAVAATIALAPMASPTLAATGELSLAVKLTGAEEYPRPGDPDGSGTATLTLNQDDGEICFTIHVSNIDLPATAAHLDLGPAGAAGPDVVILTPPDETGSSSGCADADPSIVEAIRRDPSHFYVNVYNSEFRAGALRGQLPKSSATRRRVRPTAARGGSR
jgi:hypothetical protein